MTKSDLFERESELLRGFLKEKRYEIDTESVEIIETFYGLISRYSESVMELDMGNEELSEFLIQKADFFFDKYRSSSYKHQIKIIKDPIYIYDWRSLIFKKGTLTLFYPYCLVAAANYRNFIPNFLRKMSKLDTIEFNDVFNFLYDLSTRLKPEITKWDVILIKKLVNECHLTDQYQKFILKYRANSRYRRMQDLRVLGFYHSINYPSLGLIPYMHLSDHNIPIPDNLKQYIEIKNYTSKKVFRLFLLPLEKEGEWGRILAEKGFFSKLDERYTFYNLDSLKQTISGRWKWDITPSRAAQSGKPTRYDFLSYDTIHRKLTRKFVEYLQAIHQIGTLNINDQEIKTEFSRSILKRFQTKVIKERFLLPDLFISRIGLNSCLQLIIDSKYYSRIKKLVETLPKVKVMKSGKYCRYLLYLPNSKINSVRKMIPNEGLISIDSIILTAESIQNGVDFAKTCEYRFQSS